MKSTKKRVSQRKKVVAETVVEKVILEPIVETAAAPPAITIQQNLPIKQPLRLLLVVLMLGWIYNYLFWKQSVGVNFALFLTLSLIGGVSLLLSEGYGPQRPQIGVLLIYLIGRHILLCRKLSKISRHTALTRKVSWIGTGKYGHPEMFRIRVVIMKVCERINR